MRWDLSDLVKGSYKPKEITDPETKSDQNVCLMFRTLKEGLRIEWTLDEDEKNREKHRRNQH